MGYFARVAEGDRSSDALEAFLIFAICVAGKNAATTQKKVEEFLRVGLDEGLSPFEYLALLRATGSLGREMRKHGLGKYSTLTKGFAYILDHYSERGYLSRITLTELEQVPGVGPKTSRFFVMYAQDDHHGLAVIDTHILKFLAKYEGLDVPKATPTGRRYRELEQAFIRAAERREMSSRDLDNVVWQYYAGRLPEHDRGYYEAIFRLDFAEANRLYRHWMEDDVPEVRDIAA